MFDVTFILTIISVMIAGVGFVLGWLLKSMRAQKQMNILINDYHSRIRITLEEMQQLKHKFEITTIELEASQSECNRLRLLLHENDIEGGHVINPGLLSSELENFDPDGIKKNDFYRTK